MEILTVKLDSYEGPFDLLFHLIEKNEINIYDIPIAKLTEQYLEHLNNIENRSMDNISEFILMAATLIEIKSKMLLPKEEKKIDEEEIDPREELVNRLIEYKRYKKIADILNNKEIFVNKVLFKEPEDKLIEQLIGEKIEKAEDYLSGVTLKKLYGLFQDVLKRKELKVDKVRASFKSIQKDNFTIEEQIKYLEEKLSENEKMSFSSIFEESKGKLEIIVTFLAMLEMIKLRLIKIIQENNFDEIYIVRFCM